MDLLLKQVQAALLVIVHKSKINSYFFYVIIIEGDMMLIIGSHVSFGKEQLLGAVKLMLSYEANALMFYTGAPQNTMRSKIDEEYTKAAHLLMKENNINREHIIAHAPYIINLANANPEKHAFSVSFLKGEIMRCKMLGVKYLVIHPGNRLDLTSEEAISNIIKALDEVLNIDVMILLETMAGKGTEVGSNLDELKMIIEGVKKPEYLGVCLDSCHLNDAGININDLDEYLEEFNQKIGLHKIKACHINDSKNQLGDRKDRHENIGYGKIGFNPLIKMIYHDKLTGIPKILETPYIEEHAPYQAEIKMIKAKSFNHNLVSDVISS